MGGVRSDGGEVAGGEGAGKVDVSRGTLRR